MTQAQAWKPATNEELSWFRPPGRLTPRPRPLDYTFETYAYVWGLNRALESLYFPLYELRTQLIDGELYLASLPSPFAERDLEAQLRRMRDSGLRFTRNVRATWDRHIKPEVEAYTEVMARFPAAGASGAEVAEGLNQLRRARGNQWYSAIRAVFAPVAMMEHESDQQLPEDVRSVIAEALNLIDREGGVARGGALRRVGDGLVQLGAIQRADDVHYLGYGEVRDALRHGGDRSALVAERAAAHRPSKGAVLPETFGPALPPNSPRMHLVREVLALIG
jgi:hypothetical protein